MPGPRLPTRCSSICSGIGINYFVGVDFDAFKQAVDAVGGINIDVPAGFTDNQYPAGECDEGNCGYETVRFNAGVQHMNGATALIYARSRHGNNGQGSDFARSRRQQQIIVALKAADREHRRHSASSRMSSMRSATTCSRT